MSTAKTDFPAIFLDFFPQFLENARIFTSVPQKIRHFVKKSTAH